MSPLVAGAIPLATDPSPNPTEGTLRPGLETWEVSPGLIGFVVTFALAIACVLLFLNMSKHLRQAGHNARQQGLPVPEPQVVGFRRSDSDGGTPHDAKETDDAGTSDSGATGGGPSASGPPAAGPSASSTSDTGSSTSSGSGSSGGDSGGSGD